MSTRAQEEAFEKLLLSQLTRTIDFVKFAEAKNAAVLTFSSAWLVFVSNLLAGNTHLTAEFSLFFVISLPLLALAAIVSIFSFIPKRIEHVIPKDRPLEGLLYYGDVSKIRDNSFEEKVRAAYFPEEDRAFTERYIKDLCDQITANSNIASGKFKAFTRSVILLLVSLLILAIPLTSFIIDYAHKHFLT